MHEIGGHYARAALTVSFLCQYGGKGSGTTKRRSETVVVEAEFIQHFWQTASLRWCSVSSEAVRAASRAS